MGKLSAFYMGGGDEQVSESILLSKTTVIIALSFLWPPSFHFILTRPPFQSGVSDLDMVHDLDD